MIVLDTGGLFAALVESERRHVACRDALLADDAPLLLSPFVLAELDYLLTTSLGTGAAIELLEEVARGAYQLEPFESRDVAAARGVVERYADLGIGLTDASLVVLADRHGTDRLLTLDERHFRVLRPSHGGSFTLLPSDVAE